MKKTLADHPKVTLVTQSLCCTNTKPRRIVCKQPDDIQTRDRRVFVSPDSTRIQPRDTWTSDDRIHRLAALKFARKHWNMRGRVQFAHGWLKTGQYAHVLMRWNSR